MFYWFSFALFWLKVGLIFFSQLAIIQKENNTGLVSQVPSCSRLGQSGTVPERDSPRTPTLYPRLKFLTKIVKRRRGRHTQTKKSYIKNLKVALLYHFCLLCNEFGSNCSLSGQHRELIADDPRGGAFAILFSSPPRGI